MFKRKLLNRLGDFNYFYSYIGKRVFLLLLLSTIVGFVDSIGIAMFLPLLQFTTSDMGSSNIDMGKFSSILNFLKDSGIELSLNLTLGFIVVIFMLKGLVKFIRERYNVLTQQFFMRKIRLHSLSLFENYNYNSFVNKDAGKLNNTLGAEVMRINSAYMFYFASLQSIVFVLVYLTMAFFANPQFAALVIIGGIIVNIFFNVINKKTIATSASVTKHAHIYQGQLIEAVLFYKYLKATDGAKHFFKKLAKTVRDIELNNKRIGILNALSISIREPFVVLIVAAVVIFQVTYLDKSISLILVSLLFFFRSLEQLMTLQNNWNKYLGLSGTMKNTFEFLDDLKKNQEAEYKSNFLQIKDSLKLENVSFSYGKKTVLKNVTVTIPHLKTIAFVGESGSGKTTLINVLSTLLPISEGSYFIDNNKSTEVNLKQFRQRIGYVTQDNVIFNDSIFNNVTLWAEKNNESLERFYNAIEKASLTDFVDNQSAKEDTMLGSNGVLISGGQKQRISIARELFKDIDLLIFDEATSALDSETEMIIQENINRLKGEYTIIIVAHRLSTIKNADEIVFMRSGEIINIAPFEKLQMINPDFARMVELQRME